ncbi:hypothetical protein AKJ41_01295 [candidate division MSBL1 archaeon SCGC-AAA259O05]|uniref:Uncharacterized protein n=1 Tax=candidate division MSBL1 archaeon SCGC-AAA259O05 TaxID=1698271 RepID=A0A133V4Y0_9EURY|nr:hypothetical protein AKJ41_01295 [candidate division MSBL1 archaeon SCGC-AAA259O05]
MSGPSSPSFPSFPCFPTAFLPDLDCEGTGGEAAKPGSEAGTRRRRVRNTTVEPSREKADPPSGRAPGAGVEWWRWGGGVSFFSLGRGSKANSLFFARKSIRHVCKTVPNSYKSMVPQLREHMGEYRHLKRLKEKSVYERLEKNGSGYIWLKVLLWPMG